MSMRNVFTEALEDAELKRGFTERFMHAIYSSEYEELVAKVYLSTISNYLKESILLFAFQKTLAPGQKATAEQLKSSVRITRCVSISNNATTSTEIYLSLMAKLTGWVQFKNVARHDSKARFIGGVIEAIFIAMTAKDRDKIIHLEAIQEILTSVSVSSLAKVWPVYDMVNSATYREQSWMHYKGQINDVVKIIGEIIANECAAQAEKEIQEHLSSLNKLISSCFSVFSLLIYNLYAEQEAPELLDYHGLKVMRYSENIPSLLIIGIQQIMGLNNPPQEFCYDKRGSLTVSGEKIEKLNTIIKALNGDHFVEMNDLKLRPPSPQKSAEFIRTCRQMIEENRLVLNSDGSVCLYEEKKGSRSKLIYSFHSGFSKEVYDREDRQAILKNYIEILALIQELQHWLQLNKGYYHFLSTCGKLGAFTMLPLEFHNEMERSNKQTIILLQEKINQVLASFLVPLQSAKGVETLSEGSVGDLRHKSLIVAKEMAGALENIKKSIEWEVDQMSAKREVAMKKIQDNKMSYLVNVTEMLEHIKKLSMSQSVLGKEIELMTLESQQNSLEIARQLDSAIEFKAHKKPTLEELPCLEFSMSLESILSLSVIDDSPKESIQKGIEPQIGRVEESAKECILEIKSEVGSDVSVDRLLTPALKSSTSFIASSFPSSSPSPEKQESVLLESTCMTQKKEEMKRTFNAARVTLGYDKIPQSYSPPEELLTVNESMPEDEKQTALENFKSQINLINNQALTLKNKKISRLWAFFTWSQDVNHNQAACLVLCHAMCNLFLQTIESKNSVLSAEEIRQMHDLLIKHISAQKEYWHYWHESFNNQLTLACKELTNAKNKALRVHDQLTEVKIWIEIEKNKKPVPTLDENIKDIKEKLQVPNQFLESSLRAQVDKELEEYIFNHSVIRKEFAAIDKKMQEIEITNKKLTLNPFGSSTNYDYFCLLTRLENVLTKLEKVKNTANPFSPLASLDSLIGIIKEKMGELIKRMDEKNPFSERRDQAVS